MKIILNTLIALMLVAGAAYAEQFNAVNKAGDMTVKIVFKNTPLKVGNNTGSIELLDEKGKAITDAEVALYYFMPSMPAMNYEVRASRSGDMYAAVVKPTMPGAWKAEVRVKITGGDTKRVTINFDAK
jgi:hypothetical protein